MKAVRSMKEVRPMKAVRSMKEVRSVKKVDIRINVNGHWYALVVDPYDRLIDVLREQLGLTGTKEGCAEGECGACTVNLDGKAVLSCLILAAQADGCTILTIEGLQQGAALHPLQKAFVSESAVQCGYCTPGMIMAANAHISNALASSETEPTEKSIREHLANNLCRCTGYDRPVRAVLRAVQDMREAMKEERQTDMKTDLQADLKKERKGDLHA